MACNIDYNPYYEEHIEFNTLVTQLFNSEVTNNVIYRGEDNSNYPLLPKLFRKESDNMSSQNSGNEQIDYRKMINNIGKRYTDNLPIKIADDCNTYDLCCEYASIFAFFQIANRMGLEIPPMPNSKRSLPTENGKYLVVEENTIIDEMKEYVALAQHYGLPTRFLDWTFNPLCALFFALNKVFTDEVVDTFAIYKMNMDMATLVSNHKINFVTPIYHYNPNIRAQNGTLSYVRYDNEYMHNMPLNIVLEKECKVCKIPIKPNTEPVLIKYIVESVDASEVEYILRYYGLTSDRFFPDFDGIVKGMIERYNIVK